MSADAIATRVVRFHEYGGPEVLRIEAGEASPPTAGEVRIQVKALGLNRAEALLRRGTYIESATFPSGLGLEAAGGVEAVGEGVAGVELDGAVSVIPPISMVRWLAYGERVTFPADHVVKHSASLNISIARGARVAAAAPGTAGAPSSRSRSCRTCSECTFGTSTHSASSAAATATSVDALVSPRPRRMAERFGTAMPIKFPIAARLMRRRVRSAAS